MNYELRFLQSAWKEWQKLAPPIRQQFKKKLEERIANPHVPAAALHGLAGCYKIKLRSLGYRLVYQVIDERLVVQVIAVGKRDKLSVYLKAEQRYGEE